MRSEHFPKKYKYVDGRFIVEFTSEYVGTCTEVFEMTPQTPELGYSSDTWYSCYDTSQWIPVDTRSTRAKLHGKIKDFVW